MATLTKNKAVKANQATAIQEVAKLYKVDAMTLGHVYRVRNESPFEVSEHNIPVRQLAKAEYANLLVCDMDYFSWKNNYTITEHGQRLINTIDARLATRKAVKQGLDMFPQYANIPELAKTCPIIETWNDFVRAAMRFDTAQEAFEFFKEYKNIPFEVAAEFTHKYRFCTRSQKEAFEMFYNEITQHP